MMQPLELLNNVQKARLLHNFMPYEVPDFISYLYEYTEHLLADEQAVRDSWKDQLFGVDFWLSLAAEIRKCLNRYPKDLQRSASVFADQLFGGHNALFTVHVLLRYAQEQEPLVKFKQAVHFLFA